jgi:hypothetical protein
MQVVPISSDTQVVYSFFQRSSSRVIRSKYQDPLHVLLEYIASVSPTDPFCVSCMLLRLFYANTDGVAGHRLPSGACSRLRPRTNSGGERWDCEHELCISFNIIDLFVYTQHLESLRPDVVMKHLERSKVEIGVEIEVMSGEPPVLLSYFHSNEKCLFHRP